jgi:hypothetical protein
MVQIRKCLPKVNFERFLLSVQLYKVNFERVVCVGLITIEIVPHHMCMPRKPHLSRVKGLRNGESSMAARRRRLTRGDTFNFHFH